MGKAQGETACTGRVIREWEKAVEGQDPGLWVRTRPENEAGWGRGKGVVSGASAIGSVLGPKAGKNRCSLTYSCDR